MLRLRTLYRLLSPGSEWRLPRHWFGTTALADRLDADERLAPDDTLYRGLDGLRAHQDALFAHRRGRWSDLFGAKCDVLRYGLTSTSFECGVPADETDPRRFGYSRDQGSDGVPVKVFRPVRSVRSPSPTRGPSTCAQAGSGGRPPGSPATPPPRPPRWRAAPAAAGHAAIGREFGLPPDRFLSVRRKQAA